MNAPLETHPLPTASVETVVQELEGRVHSLEEAVARLEDTQALEERVAARVADRLPQAKIVADRDAGIIEDRVMARLADRLPSAAPPPVDDPPHAPEMSAFRWGGAWTSWLFIDMVREAKLLVQMIFDRRYQMAWTTRIVALILLPAILTTHWWLPLAWLPVAGGFFVSMVNLVLAFALYKALSREARRYDARARR